MTDSDLTVRMAAPRDLPRLHELLRQVAQVHHEGRPDLFKAGRRKYTDDQLLEILADPGRPVLVAADPADLVQGYAFCVFKQFVDDNIMTDIRTLYIDDLCVDEACRGRHVGTLLYEAAVDFARAQGCYNLTLNVWSCNESARKFYEARGLAPQKIGMEVIL